MNKVSSIILILISLTYISCSREPEPIAFGKDPCELCKMTIMDQKFGGEIVTSKGKIYKFDSAECLLDFVKKGKNDQDNTESMFLTIDLYDPGKLIDARKAYFLHDESIKSPMGGNLAAFSSLEQAEKTKASPDGKVYTWNDVQNIR
jgi:copper chaperone NosL